jgi:hypothetical protein
MLILARQFDETSHHPLLTAPKQYSCSWLANETNHRRIDSNADGRIELSVEPRRYGRRQC